MHLSLAKTLCLLMLVAVCYVAFGIESAGAQIVSVAELPGLKSFSQDKAAIDGLEASGVVLIGNGKFLLVADDKTGGLKIVDAGTGEIKKTLALINSGNPKYEAMAKDGVYYYVIGAHNKSGNAGLFRFRLNDEHAEDAAAIDFHMTDMPLELSIKKSVESLNLTNDTEKDGQGKQQIEGLAVQTVKGKKRLVIGFRGPLIDGKSAIFYAELPDNLATGNNAVALTLRPYFDFVAARLNGNVVLRMSSIDYVEELKGFLILTSTEDRDNKFFGNALSFVSDESTSNSNGSAFTTVTPQCHLGCGKNFFQKDMKAEGLAVISMDSANGKLHLVVMFDNDCSPNSDTKKCSSEGSRASGKFGFLELTYK